MLLEVIKVYKMKVIKMKSIIKTNLKIFLRMFFLLQILHFSQVWAGSESNILKFKLDNQEYSFNNAKSYVQRLKNGNSKVVIALKDKEKKMMLVIMTELKDSQKGKTLQLDTNYGKVSFILKTSDFSFFISPSVRLLKNQVVSSRMYRIPNKKKRFYHKMKRASWAKLSRRQRIAQGKGVVEFKKMRGSSFFLYFKPKMKDNKIVRVIGRFSGVGRQFSRKGSSGNFHKIKNGFFNIEVSR